MTYTYVATRDHPILGMLLKVGISSDPDRRAKELGAQIHVLLPERCEREIHAYLRRKRAWRDDPAAYLFNVEPRFPAHTEWFLIDPFLGAWLRSYIAFARATEAMLA